MGRADAWGQPKHDTVGRVVLTRTRFGLGCAMPVLGQYSRASYQPNWPALDVQIYAWVLETEK